MPALDIHDAALRGMPRDDLIVVYFRRGYTLREIVGALAIRHGIVLSERSVSRILRRKRSV